MLALRARLRALRDDLANNGGASATFDWRDTATLAASAALLTLFYYYGRPNFYHLELERPLIAALQIDPAYPYKSLLPYVYWAISSVLLRIVLPLGFAAMILKMSPRELGFRPWERGHGRYYAGLYLLMLPLLIAASFLPSFQSKYPFYKDAGLSLTHFVIYELCYGVQFASLEAFFRGFMIFALFKRFGYQGVAIMTIPYCLIHFNKPVPETLGAIIAGLVLGYMALKSKSWLPGALLHWGIGTTMDVACMIHKGLGR